jgi:predicted nucleic acid-binding Zn finger protein
VFVGKHNDYVILNGYMFCGLQLCIPNSSLWERIIRELYGEGHFGQDKTLALV